MFELLIVLHIISAILIIGLILLQHGKGAEAGAAFGNGASATVFGSQGAGSFLTRTTAVLVTIFFIINLSLANLTNRSIKQRDAIDLAPMQPVKTQPANSDVPGL